MTVTKQQLFMLYAMQFNFELDKDQLLAEALKCNFITQVSDDQYLINENY
jgi:hypothetical protein